jgi:hypothetical protein
MEAHMDELRRLLERPLSVSSLRELTASAFREARASQHPTGAFILAGVFNDLLARLEGEVLDADVAAVRESVLHPALVALVDADPGQPSLFIEVADNAIRTYFMSR